MAEKKTKLTAVEAAKKVAKAMHEQLSQAKKLMKNELTPSEAHLKLTNAIRKEISDYQEKLVKMRNIEGLEKSLYGLPSSTPSDQQMQHKLTKTVFDTLKKPQGLAPMGGAGLQEAPLPQGGIKLPMSASKSPIFGAKAQKSAANSPVFGKSDESLDKAVKGKVDIYAPKDDPNVVPVSHGKYTVHHENPNWVVHYKGNDGAGEHLGNFATGLNHVAKVIGDHHQKISGKSERVVLKADKELEETSPSEETSETEASREPESVLPSDRPSVSVDAKDTGSGGQIKKGKKMKKSESALVKAGFLGGKSADSKMMTTQALSVASKEAKNKKMPAQQQSMKMPSMEQHAQRADMLGSFMPKGKFDKAALEKDMAELDKFCKH